MAILIAPTAKRPNVRVIGGGLAGVEAAHFLSRAGIHVDLFEMRPQNKTPAHKTDLLAELVCSNSFKGFDPLTAHGILKREMSELGSIVLSTAEKTSVPAGKALAVDRMAFSYLITRHFENHPMVTLHRQEVKKTDLDCATIIATGPLTSDELAKDLSLKTGSSRLFFYDAISPIIDADSIDMNYAFFGARWSDDSQDYLNCPLDEGQYKRFMEELLNADRVRAREFEDARFFEACLPIEILAARGADALRYGPMRPVGLRSPSTGRRPYAVVQLRRENLPGNAYNMVGFQTRLTYAEQRRIMGLIPGLASARYLRYGSIHRNTFLDSPRVLEPSLRLSGLSNTFIAGQITGVEGYMESAATGILAGISMAAWLGEKPFIPPGPDTAMGALIHYITDRSMGIFEPMNINFGIMTMPDVHKSKRVQARSEIASASFARWKGSLPFI